MKKQIVFSLLAAVALFLAACSQGIISPSEDVDITAVADLPQPGTVRSPIEGYARYNGEPYGCGSPLKTGPQKLKDYLRKLGITANTYTTGCRTSFHQVGRALDIFIANDPNSGPQKQAFANWLTANNGEMARRLGLSQVVWNRRMWRSYPKDGKPAGVWGKHYGDNPHIDHVHLSFEGAGANGTTSFFRDIIDGNPTVPLPKRTGKLQDTRYKDGPCAGKGSNCTFDARTFVTIGGKQIESITAYGKYWDYAGGKLTSDFLYKVTARYSSPGGPCYGKGSTCRFDSRTFVTIRGQQVESITAYGRYWNFVGGRAFNPDKQGKLLSSVSRYVGTKAAPGPCFGKTVCKFDTRTFVNLGGQQVESITAYGRYWNFVENKAWNPSAQGKPLYSADRYKNGPCKDKGSGCTFDSRTFVNIGGTLVESITAYGQYWNFY